LWILGTRRVFSLRVVGDARNSVAGLKRGRVVTTSAAHVAGQAWSQRTVARDVYDVSLRQATIGPTDRCDRFESSPL
jgi:hypothetical protein